MAKPYQVRGMLLEEAILKLLRRSGYDPVLDAQNDPTLSGNPSSLQVKGRGEDHQIDAIADLTFSPPLLNRQRLLVEAKAYNDGRSVGIERVRNGVGVLSDVRQFFFGQDQADLNSWRYHYQYVIVSTSSFTQPAQRYAFAHDIPLIPLGNSPLFRPIREAVFDVTDRLPIGNDGHVQDLPPDLRMRIRVAFLEEGDGGLEAPYRDLVRALEAYDGAILAMIAGSFPILLTPAQDFDVETLEPVVNVEVSWNDDGWFLRQPNGTEPWFSFDLPRTLFRCYSDEQGVLSKERALALKEDFLDDIHGYVRQNATLGLVRFRLAPDWLEELRRGLE